MRISIKQLGAAVLAVVLGAGAVASLGQPDPASAAADGSTVVINEVYGGGGNSGAPYSRDFVELYNPTNAAIDLGGYQVVRYSGSGNPQSSDIVTIPAGTTIEPGATLVVGGAYGSNTSAADVPVDVEGNFGLGATSAALNLTDASGTIVDLVGFGTVGGNAFETAAAPALSNSTSAQRIPDGVDTDDNSADFEAAEPTPGALNASDETPAPTETTEPTATPEPTAPAECDVAISEIQGTGAATPLPTDQAVTTCGVVTASYTTGGLNGFYLQTPTTDAAGQPVEQADDASNGIFVYTNSAPTVAIGDSVQITGTPDEYNGLTQLVQPSITAVDALGTVEPLELAAWPTTEDERELYEGMLVAPQGAYTVTDNYSLNSYGEVGLAFGEGPLVNATEVGAPGSAEAQAQVDENTARAVLLDDGASWNYQSNATAKNSPLPYLSLQTPVTVGATASFDQPMIVSYGFDMWRFQPQQQVVGAENAPVSFSEVREDAPVDFSGSDYSVASFNVLNYFTTLGTDEDGCAYYTDREGNPTTANDCTVRGAYDTENFERQQVKIVNAINALDASVIALEEIEDSSDFGQDRDAALANLVDELNAAAGSDKWSYVASPDTVPANGDDVIRTAFIYQDAEVSYVDGSTEILDDSAFVNARAPLAATFAPVANEDEHFVVIANHFKSKGGSGEGDNANNDDGNPASATGGWNGDRVRQAQALLEFADAQQAEQSTDLLFITGDLNSYSMEAPVTTLTDAGYVPVASDGSEYSYLYTSELATGGKIGTVGSLDHILLSPAAAEQMNSSDIWTINAYEPIALEYSRFNANVTNFYDESPYRASDHNPIIVGMSTTPVETPEPTESPEPTETTAPTTPATETPEPTASQTESQEPQLVTEQEHYTAAESAAGVQYVGVNFAANASVNIAISIDGGEPQSVESLTADADGTITGQLTYQTVDSETGAVIEDNLPWPAGSYTIIATQGELSATVTFTVGEDAAATDGTATATASATATSEPSDTDDATETSIPVDGTNNAGDQLATTGANESAMFMGIASGVIALALGGALVLLRRRYNEA
ncbi:ExeM/NucH family extracellular endonuclease [Gulosibacter sediminis]|uniref:ExeM/NucH family extracellular endonuclease n=1 Tax=Gulosibacter sediminis TaxID=1729695 RepID=UPI0024A959BE|nr:ExeM/NucH family extracellular endonuclease [Gulosibacter sediminis]